MQSVFGLASHANFHAGSLSRLGVSRFCQKYPAVLATLQRSILELVCKYQKTVLGCGRLRPLAELWAACRTYTARAEGIMTS